MVGETSDEAAGSLTIALIHAVVPAMEPMQAALAQTLPHARVLNLLDEGLLNEVERRGGLTPECVDRLSTLVGLAQEAGAAAVLLTCNAYTPVVGDVQTRFPELPVLPVDEVMVERAVRSATRIGVLATVEAGLKQQRESLEGAARRAGKQIVLTASLHPEAMDALRRGDADTHDRILLEALPQLAAQVEVVLLAQASMARLMDKLPPNLPAPVLASPQLAVQALKERLAR